MNAVVGTTDFAAAVRSSVLELVSSARMLGKAEMLCELDSEADPSVRAEFEQRVRQARTSLELLLAGGSDAGMPGLSGQAERPSALGDKAASLTPAPPPPLPAPAARPAPQALTPDAAAGSTFSDWDEEARIGIGPMLLAGIAVLGLAAWWFLQGAPGGSGAFQYYQQRERCIAVSDALLDLRNGRAPRLKESREQLLREDADCTMNGVNALPPR